MTGERSKARQSAEEICKGFEYTCIANGDGRHSVQVWRCADPKDGDHSHDLVITGMGICAMGDMDPLVFRRGYDLAYLAGENVAHSIHSKLDESSKSWDLDMDVVHERVAGDLIQHLDAIWGGDGGGKETPLSGGPVKEAVDALRAAQAGEHFKAMTGLLGVLQQVASEDSSVWPAAARWTKRSAVRERLESLLLDLSEVRTVGDLRECLNLADSEFNGIFDDFDPEGLLKPSESVLVRLHILNIGARRILELQREQEPVILQVDRQRG